MMEARPGGPPSFVSPEVGDEELEGQLFPTMPCRLILLSLSSLLPPEPFFVRERERERRENVCGWGKWNVGENVVRLFYSLLVDLCI